MDIKKVVLNNGYTLTQIARVLGISQPDLTQRIKRESLSVKQCKLIARTIGVSLDALVSDDDEPPHSHDVVCPHCSKPISVHLDTI